MWEGPRIAFESKGGEGVSSMVRGFEGGYLFTGKH
jgi:hypothetical protein